MVIGTSITYVAGGDAISLPRPGDRPVVHRPWCCDCKRKHDADQLDTDSRCTRCARAAITRTKAAERRAADAEAQTASLVELERRHQSEVNAEARRKAQPTRAPRPTPPPRTAPTEALQHLERYDPNVTSPAYDAQVEETQPLERVAPSQLTFTPADNLSAQMAHVTRVLTTTHDHPNYAVQVLRQNALGALEALHLVNEIVTSADTSRPRTPAARTGKGKPTRQPGPRPVRPDKIVLPDADIITAYKAGQTLSELAAHYNVSGPTIRRVLIEHNIARRKSRVHHTPELVDQVRSLYNDEHLTQAEIGDRLGHSTKVIQRLMTAAGVDRRAAKARHAIDNAADLKSAIAALGATSADIRAWATVHGHEVSTRGLPNRAVVDAYAAHHQPSPPTTGDTAA